MSEQFTVRAFQIARICGHGAACSDDWEQRWPMELHSDFGRYAVVPAEWYRALDPKVGSWVIEYPDGRLSFRSEEAFAKDYTFVEGQWYLTKWQPLFSGKILVMGIDPAAVGGDETTRTIVVDAEDSKYAEYLEALSKVMLLPIDLDVRVRLIK